jgi:hypothetical protein
LSEITEPNKTKLGMLLEETPAYLGNALKAINQTQLLGADMISLQSIE